MNKYDFRLTPAYCLFNGAGVKNQNGNEITFLLENTNNEELKTKLKKAFVSHLDYLRTKENCPEIYKKSEIINFELGSRNDLRKYVSSLYEDISLEDEEKISEEKKLEVESAAVLLLDAIINEACRLGATDIHIENSQIRYRVQGNLISGLKIEADKKDELIRRIKMLAGLNVLDAKNSQDGQFTYGDKHRVFIRVSTMSVISNGYNSVDESVVLRLLDTSRIPLSINKLGFNGIQIEELEKIISLKSGLLLVCGPTGAGKSTTAAALLMEIARTNKGQKKIISLEDPPEYFIPDVTQIKVDAERKNSFSEILKHIFRQDPDVIMIGEIRDSESCETAIRASLTGHLVIATLHTDNIADSFFRLENLGTDYSALCSVIRGILIQEMNFYKGNTSLLAELSIPKKSLRKETVVNRNTIDQYFDFYTNAGSVLKSTIVNQKTENQDSAKLKTAGKNKIRKTKVHHLISTALNEAAEKEEA